MIRYGKTLPTMIDQGRNGDTRSASRVPVSFSRVREIAVISDEMIVRTNAIRPGTNRFELWRVGLNRVRTCALIVKGPGLLREPRPTLSGEAPGMVREPWPTVSAANRATTAWA